MFNKDLKTALTAALTLTWGLATLAPLAAHADALASLKTFVNQAKTGKGDFTQTVTSPDGKKKRASTGTLEFQRPNRFRFAYNQPNEQLIVGDGKRVWLWDADLNQVTVRPMSEAVGATPAALLSGSSLEKDFILKTLPAKAISAATAGSAPLQGVHDLEWVEALPRTKDGQFQSVRVGFSKGGVFTALEILDSFGQTSRLDFARFDAKAVLPPSRFQFTPPAGADVLNQP